MATSWLVMSPFTAAVGGAGTQRFRPGDVVLDDDPEFSKIRAAAPTFAALVSGFPSDLPAEAVSRRLRAVPDDVVEVFCLETWAEWCW